MPERAPGLRPWSAVHFVGVGGHSMSGLACALARLGVPVSGSDLARSPRTDRASASGVRVLIGHDAAWVDRLPDGAAVVYNTDVPTANPELAAARGRRLEVLHRSAVLDWFLRGGHLPPGRAQPAVAVTGTHGKTTTSSLAGLALLAGGLDPTVFVGAAVAYLDGANHRLGAGPVVAEADESDGSFVRYRPDLAVVTSVEPEHLEHYAGSFDRVRAAYGSFLAALPPGGTAVLCSDDPVLRCLAPSGREVLWYGLEPGAALTAADLTLGADSVFTPVLRGSALGRVRLGAPGRHNVANALAAIAVAHSLGADMEAYAPALAGFRGATRRFQILTRAGGITVVDDYAHNPTKVAAALAAARLLSPERLVAVFQPHRYQRTRQLWEAFGRAFRAADLVLLADIYAPTGEEPIPGVSSEALAQVIAAGSEVPVRYVPAAESAARRAAAMAAPGDLYLVMGAGDITRAAHQLAGLLDPAFEEGSREASAAGGLRSSHAQQAAARLPGSPGR